YLTIGDELFEHEKEIETSTITRMMGILKLSVVPSRRNLINFIEGNKLLDDPTCDENVKSLYHLLQNETNPITIGKRGVELVNFLKSNSKFEKFADLISKNLILKGMTLMSKNYE